MLTGPLVQARVRGDTLTPARVDPSDPALLDASVALGAIFEAALADRATRAEVDAAVDAEVAERPRPKIVQGLARLIDDRCTFEAATPIEPAALRARVFALARERGPLALAPDPLGRPTARDVLDAVGAELGIDAGAVHDALYADLAENHRLIAARLPPSPAWLLHRYNVAQVQAVLLHAVELRIALDAPTSPRMRQLFRQVKFHRLLHRARRDGGTLELTLDGPTSLFQQSTRYGLALANFFPALLLQPGPWTLEATVLWTRARHRRVLKVRHDDGLVSHYEDRGGYRTREQEWFAERFAARDTAWALEEGQEPIALGGHGVLFPDFTLRRGERAVHLEILGFWRHDDLARRIALIDRYGPGNVVLAVSRKLAGSREVLADAPPWVVDFAEVLPPKAVIDAADALSDR